MTEQRPPEYPTLQHYQPSPFMLPEETLPLRVARDHVPYDRWEQQGYLQTTEGNVVHYGYIERFIDALGQKFHIKEIAYDRWGDSPQCGEMSRRDKRAGHLLKWRTSCPP